MCLSLHCQGWLCYCKNTRKESYSSSVMLLSQQIHFLRKRGREQQSYIHLQPNLPLVITSALARADILPAKNIIRATTWRILLLNSLFSASFTGRAFYKQHVGALAELNTNNLNFPLTPILRLKFLSASSLTGMLARQSSRFPPSPAPLRRYLRPCVQSKSPAEAINATTALAKGRRQRCPNPNLNARPQ